MLKMRRKKKQIVLSCMHQPPGVFIARLSASGPPHGRALPWHSYHKAIHTICEFLVLKRSIKFITIIIFSLHHQPDINLLVYYDDNRRTTNNSLIAIHNSYHTASTSIVYPTVEQHQLQ